MRVFHNEEELAGQGLPEGIFTFQAAASVMNPTQVRWSFRVLPPGTKAADDAYYTINRDVIGRGTMKWQEIWRIYRGRKRDQQQVYYIVGSLTGWDYKVYRSETEADADGPPVAQITQARGTSSVAGDGVPGWVSGKYEVRVKSGGDGGLILTLATILDLAHERSRPANSGT